MLLLRNAFERGASLLSVVLYRQKPICVKTGDLGVFLLVEHWHVRFTAPAPKQLHLSSTLIDIFDLFVS